MADAFQTAVRRERIGAVCRGISPVELGVMPVTVDPDTGGYAYDNAMWERFFATLQSELLDRRRFKTQAEARRVVFAFIEEFYNLRRRHSSIGYLSPIEFERRHQAMVVVPDAHQPAAVLAAVLDRLCARPPQHRVRRDGGAASPEAEPKNAAIQENSMCSDLVP